MQNAQGTKRGLTTVEYDNQFVELKDSDLFSLLKDSNPMKRTAAANIICRRKTADAVAPLCEALKTEKVLYSKIGICNALAAIGQPALPSLVLLLGAIGENRHRGLPEKGFYKVSYPLPRDIAARTIIRIGVPALKYLKQVFTGGEKDKILEAVDAAGHISFYSKDDSVKNDLIELYHKYSNDKMIIWKVLRSFQAFNTVEVNLILRDVIINSSIPAYRWEAARSLALNGSKIDDELKKYLLNSEDGELKQIAKVFY